MVPDLELDPVRAELEGNLAQDCHCHFALCRGEPRPRSCNAVIEDLLLGVGVLHLASHERQELGEVDGAAAVGVQLARTARHKLIGTNGQTIKNIQEKVSTVRVITPGKDDAASDEYKFVAVTLKGKASDVFKASKMIHDVATACLAVLTFRIGAASFPCPSRPRGGHAPAPVLCDADDASSASSGPC